MNAIPDSAAALADQAEARAFADFFAAAPPVLRARLGLQVEQIADATLLLAPGMASPLFNRAIGFGLQRKPRPGDLNQIVDRLAQAANPRWALTWSAASSCPVEDLAARGLTRRSSWAKMMRDTAAAPAFVSDLRVDLATADQIGAVGRVFAAAFGLPADLADWLCALQDRPGWRVYAIRDEEIVVGCGCLYLVDGQGWAGMGAVAASHRRRRGQSLLMARRIADARAGGARRIFTETGEPEDGSVNPSLNTMLRCGFTRVASRVNLQIRESP